MKYTINSNVYMNKDVYTKKVMRENVKKYITLFEMNHISRGDLIIFQTGRCPELISLIFAALSLEVTFCIIEPETPIKRVELAFEYATLVIQMDINQGVVCTKNIKKKVFDFSRAAYISFTSGTTGQAKGVMIPRSALDNFVKGIPKVVPVKKRKAIVSFTSCTFDIFLLEVILAPLYRIDIYLANEKECKNPKKMAELLKFCRADLLQMTPSMLTMLHMVDSLWESLQNIKVLMVGGEIFSQKLLLSLQKNIDARIFNMYGPTETTIWSTVEELTKSGLVSVGKPIRETRIYILSQSLELMPSQEMGEICIAGKGLAIGYLGNEEKTKECFVRLPWKKEEIVYRTGDIGFINHEGVLCCQGRNDNQVKIRGHRIELEDVDMNLLKSGLVDNCCTCYDSKRQILVCFYLTKKKEVTEADLREHMKTVVPLYMMPAQFVQTSQLIYTSSGKLDRKGMLLQNNKVRDTDIIQDVKTILMNSSGYNEKIDFETSLDACGLDSLSFINLIVEIEKRYGIEIDDDKLDIASFHTIRELIEHILTIVNEKRENYD